jgi:hypothetical protein
VRELEKILKYFSGIIFFTLNSNPNLDWTGTRPEGESCAAHTTPCTRKKTSGVE